MESRAFPSDVTNVEWAFDTPQLTLITQEALRREYSLPKIFNGLRWINAGVFSSIMPDLEFSRTCPQDEKDDRQRPFLKAERRNRRQKAANGLITIDIIAIRVAKRKFRCMPCGGCWLCM